MKTEPSVFSFEDLVRTPSKITSWEGVRNFQARNFMRDEFKKQDQALIYHSGVEEPAIVGLAEIVREGYPDPSALDPKNKYYDPDSKKSGKNNWVMVDIKATQRFQLPLTRKVLQENSLLKHMMVMKKGMRLSIQPVTLEEFRIVVHLGSPVPV